MTGFTYRGVEVPLEYAEAALLEIPGFNAWTEGIDAAFDSPTITRMMAQAEDKVSQELQAFIDAVREARERDLTLEGYRQDVEYWTHGVSRQAFYRLDPEVDHPGPETIDTFYLDEETVNRGHLLESYVRQDKTPCSVLDVPEEFRL